MSVRIFTLLEANQLLPRIREEIDWFRATVQVIVRAQDALGVLDVIGAAERTSPEHGEYETQRARLDDLAEEYNARLDKFSQLGCVIKDLESGLVDFYGEKEGRLIFLCWRDGEAEVKWWHEVNDGFRGRRPVSEL